MGWPKQLTGYPEDMFTILERAIELKKDIVITFATPGKATNERFRWYAFFALLRKENHHLAPLTSQCKLKTDKANFVIAVTEASRLDSTDSVYKRTALMLDALAVDK